MGVRKSVIQTGSDLTSWYQDRVEVVSLGNTGLLGKLESQILEEDLSLHNYELSTIAVGCKIQYQLIIKPVMEHLTHSNGIIFHIEFYKYLGSSNFQYWKSIP